MKNRIKVKNVILKEVVNTKHQLERFKTRFNVLCQGDIDNEDKMNILRNVNALNQLTLDNKSYAVRLGDFKVNKNSKYFIDVNGRGYYRVNDELFKDSTGNEFWAIVRNNVITTFMLRKDIQSRDVNHMKDRLRVDDIIFDISKINTNETVSEEVIDEDFNSQNMIEELSRDILKNYINQYVEKAFLTRDFPYKFRPNVFNGLKYKYGNFNKFIRDFKLYMGFSDRINVKGYFSPLGDSGEIIINVNEKIIYDYILANYERYNKEEIKEEVYYDIYNGDFISVLRHELQHAYDYYISDGKFTSDKSSKAYYAAKRNNAPKTNRLKLKYLRLQHEVNARFTEAIAELNSYGLFNTDSNSFVELWEYLDNFKTLYYGWENMTPKIQKYLMRRASQYYYKYKENFENKKKGE